MLVGPKGCSRVAFLHLLRGLTAAQPLVCGDGLGFFSPGADRMGFVYDKTRAVESESDYPPLEVGEGSNAHWDIERTAEELLLIGKQTSFH